MKGIRFWMLMTGFGLLAISVPLAVGLFGRPTPAFAVGDHLQLAGTRTTVEIATVTPATFLDLSQFPPLVRGWHYGLRNPAGHILHLDGNKKMLQDWACANPHPPSP